ncbi:MAG: hypothetical protein SW019_25970 [Actinomycetota bacterium]|nr:hypothetical protein [Actinomycetota bacterium]
MGTEPVDVPATGEVLLAWDQPEVGAQSSRLAGHTAAVLRRADQVR